MTAPWNGLSAPVLRTQVGHGPPADAPRAVYIRNEMEIECFLGPEMKTIQIIWCPRLWGREPRWVRKEDIKR